MRHIAPDIFTDEFVGGLAAEHRLLWIGIVACLADDQGRLIDSPMMMRGQIFTYDAHMTDEIVNWGLRIFERQHKIIRYAAGNNGSGRRLIQIIKWWKYQASAHWAAPSKYPAPTGWMDRVRSHQGQQIVAENWDRNGGLRNVGGWQKKAATTLVQRRTNVGPVKAQEEVDVKDEDEDDKEKGIPPSLPSPQQDTAKADGGRETYARLNVDQRQVADRIQKILAAASFSDKRKAVSLSVLVATRIYEGGPIHHVVASFASTFASSKVHDPVAVAVHQLQHDKVPPAFNDPNTWRSVPQEILQAAGIENLNAYKISQFFRG